MSTATTHELEATRAVLHGQFSTGLDPVLTVASGDRVRYRWIPDVAWGLENHNEDDRPRRKVQPRTSPRDDGPCLVGPVVVEGAEPGDTLAVHIETVRQGPWGWTLAGDVDFFNTDLNRALGVDEGDPMILRWDLSGKEAVDQNGHRVALRPMLGTIGTCPAGDGWQSAWPPRRTGGNMDAAVLTDGSVLYLPVEVAGARVSVGDGHAAQGHGESSGTGIECLLDRVDLRYVLHKELEVNAPRAETPRGWVTFGVGEALDDAAAEALRGMMRWLTTTFDVSRKEALALISVSVDLEITQVVNGVKGVHAVLPSEVRRQLFGAS